MRIQFSLRTMFLAVFLIAILLWFFTPVAGINSATCARIQPGMSEQQAQEIVGAPPGWYDGVGGISTAAPSYKGYKPSWVGLRGEILIDLDNTGRVSRATFYPGKVLNWSVVDYVWERFTRIKYASVSLPARIVLQLALVAIVISVLGVLIIRADATNQIALYGLIGLVVGLILSVAIFSDGFFVDLLLTSLVLSSPIIGAVVGIGVGFIRGVFAIHRPRTAKTHVSMVTTNVT